MSPGFWPSSAGEWLELSLKFAGIAAVVGGFIKVLWLRPIEKEQERLSRDTLPEMEKRILDKIETQGKLNTTEFNRLDQQHKHFVSVEVPQLGKMRDERIDGFTKAVREDVNGLGTRVDANHEMLVAQDTRISVMERQQVETNANINLMFRDIGELKEITRGASEASIAMQQGLNLKFIEMKDFMQAKTESLAIQLAEVKTEIRVRRELKEG